MRLKLMIVLALLMWCHVARAQTLLAHSSVTHTGDIWSYVLVNDELSTSNLFLGDFYLGVNAPFTVTGAPVGWDFNTDNASYVFWFNTDSVLPYPHDIGQGQSLSGFTLQSSGTGSALSGYTISSWDHDLDSPGPAAAGRVLTPTAAPEPSAIVGGIAFTVVGLFMIGARRGLKTIN